ncbi:hypothetical protein [Anaerotignum sp.]|uniref:hypothetical protein n=1 Tax=Anaerotignum sp. TaxID=2039241 RepID=UPI0028A69179|nr:hypothetical protein [Anaerotignum sp.]
MKRNRLVMIGLSVFLLTQTAIPVCAAEYPTIPTETSSYTSAIVPRMKYTARVAANLIIDSKGKATVTASVDGYKSITSKVSLSAELQRYKNGKWSNVTTFSDSDNSHRIRLYETYRVSKGYKYRVVVTSTAVHNGKSETRTVTSSSTAY